MAGNTDVFVVDASFILAYLLPDEKSPVSDGFIIKYRNSQITIISSTIFNLEVFNGLQAAKRSKRISGQKCLKIAKRFMEIGIICEKVDDYETFLLALSEDLSVYDASYVYLARVKSTKLLTLDARLKKLAG